MKKKYINGELPDPPKKKGRPIKSINLSPEQQKEAEEDALWFNNWTANRVVNGVKLKKGYQIPSSQIVEGRDLNINKIKDGYTENAAYDPETGNISLDYHSYDQPGIPVHEYAHRYQDRTKLVRPKTYNDYILKPISNLVPNVETYESDPNEIHSELMRLRRNANFRPDQTITPDDVQEIDLNNYNFSGANKDTLIQLLNSTAQNTNISNSNIQTAKLGGLLTNNMKKQYALGGQLTQFNEGGTHEQNPNGGIPMGTNASVEQGETKMSTPEGQFIFSDRIEITPTVAKTLNLPKSWIGKTMADYSKKLDAQFKDRNDSLSRNTKQRMLDRGAEVQEAIKAQQEALIQAQNTNALQAPEDMMNGQIPAGMEEYSETPMALGGYVRKQMFGGGPLEEVKPTIVTNEGQLEASKLKNDALNQKLQPYVNAYNNVIPTISNMVNSDSGDAQRTQTLQSINTIGSGVGSAIGGATGSTIGGIVSGATGLYDMGSEAFGRSNVDTSGVQSQSGASAGKSAGAGALKGLGTGAAIGSFVGPIGTAIGAGIGALVGGAAGFVGGKKDEKAQVKNNTRYSQNYNKQFSDQYALGGVITPNELIESSQLRRASQNNAQYAIGGKLPRPTANLEYPNLLNNYDITTDISLPQVIESATIPQQTKAQFENYANQATVHPTIMQKLGILKDKVDPYLVTAGDKLGNALRYAPLAMDVYQLSKLKKPQGERLNRLSNRYIPNYTDLAAQQNIVNQELNNVSNAIQGSGASQGAIRANLLGAQLNKSKALSQAYADAEARNAQQNALAQQFNLGVDSTNLNQANAEQDINARNLGAYETQKSRLLGNIGTTTGEIGKEEKYKSMVKGMFGYDSNGKYVIDPNGNKLYVTPTSEKKALGGIVMKKRKY